MALHLNRDNHPFGAQRMSRSERASWSELHHLRILRMIALLGVLGAAALVMQAIQLSFVLGLVAIFFSPVVVLAVVTVAERTFLRR